MEPTPTPLCRCRVLYTGSSVPTIAKDGLQGIQEPLGKLYPAEGLLDSRGIDSWLSVWMNGLLLQYADNSEKEQFFPIESLHYCAAVRFVNICGYSVAGGGQQFLPLDSPFANLPDSKHPPVFAAILRRTTGVRVLECHAFVCTSPGAANALVRCCFHAYAENFLHNSSHIASLRRQHSGLKCPSEEKCDEDDDDNNDNNDHTHHHHHHNGPTSNCSGRSSSPEASEIVFQNGYDSDTVNTWQRRQQAGDCDTASVSSSAAARYKKNKKLESKRGTLKNYPTQWSTQRLETNLRNPEVALLPYQRACSTADGRRRSRSETDLRFTTATRHPAEHALVPYVEPTAALLPYDQPAASSPASMTEPFPPPLPLTALVPYSHLFRPPFFPPRPTLAPLDRGPPPPPPSPLMFMPPVRAFPFLPPMLFPDQLPPSTPPRRKKRAKSGQHPPTLVPQPFAVMPPAAAPLPSPFFSFEEPPYASMASCRPFVDNPRLYGRFARSGSQPSLRDPDPTWPYPTAADPTLLPPQQDVLFDANSFFVDPPTLPYRPNSRFTNGQAYYSPLQPDFSARRRQQLGGGHFNQPPKVHKTNGGYSPDLEPKMQALQLNNPTRQMPKSSKSSSRTSKADVHLIFRVDVSAAFFKSLHFMHRMRFDLLRAVYLDTKLPIHHGHSLESHSR
ncbi:hypothetical protein T09_5052 [Trichinella sp. T9]|nr:hypothetical protein T09_5052 [Trichinella sp. T9]